MVLALAVAFGHLFGLFIDLNFFFLGLEEVKVEGGELVGFVLDGVVELSKNAHVFAC